MKYYVYVSLTKLEMLYGQIDTPKSKKREASIGFDFKLVKGDFKEAREQNDSVYAKLTATVAELDSAGLIGTLRSRTHPFIRGSYEMIWADYGWGKDPGITFWAFKNNDFALALAGSKFHVLGEQQNGAVGSHSLTGPIVLWLRSHLGEPFPENTEETPRDRSFGGIDEEIVAQGLWLTITQTDGPRNKFEFVAKVLFRSTGKDFSTGRIIPIILASPLYVSLAK
jgi:hypothetical protein